MARHRFIFSSVYNSYGAHSAPLLSRLEDQPESGATRYAMFRQSPEPLPPVRDLGPLAAHGPRDEETGAKPLVRAVQIIRKDKICPLRCRLSGRCSYPPVLRRIH